MYYSYKCPYCSKEYYTYTDDKEQAAKNLFTGLVKHEHDYGEDQKDNTLQEYDPETETNMIYTLIQDSPTKPPGGYSLD